MPYTYALKFSIKNETGSVLKAEVAVVEIPSKDAGFEEYIIIPDEEIWSDFPKCTINPGKYGYAHNPNFYPAIDSDKCVSFIFTICRGSEVIYRVVGWDIPEEDMETHGIDDKMWGLYDPAEQEPLDNRGCERLTSKLFNGYEETGNIISSLTYYIRATPTGVILQEMNPSSLWVDDKEYWK